MLSVVAVLWLEPPAQPLKRESRQARRSKGLVIGLCIVFLFGATTPPPPQRYEKNTAYLYGMQGRAAYRLYPKGTPCCISPKLYAKMNAKQSAIFVLCKRSL